MSRRVWTVGLVLSLGLGACEPDEDKTTPRSAPSADRGGYPDAGAAATGTEVVRGHYVFGHETRALRPCGAEEALWVVDRSGLLNDLHAELAPGDAPHAGIFVVVAGATGPPPEEGFGADYSGTFTVEKVSYATSEGHGCQFDWGRFDYRSHGNEPFWTVEVAAGEMKLVRPGHPERTWSGVSTLEGDGGVEIRATGERQTTVELLVSGRPSRDSMTGAYYALSARLILDGDTLSGYALKGTALGRPR